MGIVCSSKRIVSQERACGARVAGWNAGEAFRLVEPACTFSYSLADPLPNRASNGSAGPGLHRYAGCIWTIVSLSGSNTPMALLLAWLPGDLHAPSGPQSEAEVQLAGKLMCATTVPAP